MKIYDTLTQELREFVELENKKIKMYVCGPTVYDFPHLGHARCYITWDMVVRYLRFKGYDVTYARNITDIDDKIINKAKAVGCTTDEIAAKYYDEFKMAMESLNVAEPDIEPKATENIQEMLDMISALIEKGSAYEVDGDVYFRVSSYSKYGRLGKQNLEDLKAGARNETADKKEDPLDFALWKAEKDENEVSWPSPWGNGRPGWHSECAAMINKHLGATIDIHAGGQDLTFPHHENERAQAECAFGQEFVRNWMHNGFVIINKEKMSKSLGNFVTINDVLEKYDSNTIRFFILTNHYRMPVEFVAESLDSAKAGARRLKNAVDDVKAVVTQEELEKADKILSVMYEEIAKTGNLPFHEVDKFTELESEVPVEAAGYIIKSLKDFLNAMDDDFNTSKALAVLFDIAGCAQRKKTQKDSLESVYCLALLLKLSSVLGFDFSKSQELDDNLSSQLMDIIIKLRATVKEQKNWTIADQIRDELKNVGITLKDQKDGKTVWSIE